MAGTRYEEGRGLSDPVLDILAGPLCTSAEHAPPRHVALFDDRIDLFSNILPDGPPCDGTLMRSTPMMELLYVGTGDDREAEWPMWWIFPPDLESVRSDQAPSKKPVSLSIITPMRLPAQSDVRIGLAIEREIDDGWLRFLGLMKPARLSRFEEGPPGIWEFVRAEVQVMSPGPILRESRLLASASTLSRWFEEHLRGLMARGRRKRPLAGHEYLDTGESRDLLAIYRAMRYNPSQITVMSSAAQEAA